MTDEKHENPGKVFIVDDQPANLTILSTLLNSRGYTVISAQDGEEALQVVHDIMPDVILLDVRMPGIDGYEVCEHMKADPTLADIPVLFVSALDTTDDQIRGFEAGGVDFITKPFNVREVLARVETHVRLKQQAQEITQLRHRDQQQIKQLRQEIRQRKKLQYELHKLFRAVEQSANSIIITDAEGHIEYVNPKFVQLTGYSRGEVRGKNPDLLRSGMSPDEMYDDMWATIRSGREWHGAFHNRKKNGELFWETATISPIKDQNGTITHYIAVKEDITARKEAEQALYVAMQRLSTLNRLISSTTSNLTPERVIDTTLRELRTVFGASRVFAATVDEDSPNLVIRAQNPNRQDGSIIGLQIPNDSALVKYFNAQPIPYTCTDTAADPILDDLPLDKLAVCGGSYMVLPMMSHAVLIGILFICFDEARNYNEHEIVLGGEVGQAAAQALDNSLLHRQMQTNNARLGHLVEERTSQLDRLNTRMAAILASVSDAIILVHEDGTIDITNRGFDEQFGYMPDELFGQKLEKIVTEPYAEMIQYAVERARNGEAVLHIQMEAKRKDGTIFDIDVSFDSIGDDENHVVCSAHDISLLKETERMKDNFVSMVTHELRTPIAGIMLISNTLNKYYDRIDEDTRRHKIEQLHTQSKVMAELVESVLDISRLEARREHRPTGEVVHMPEVVEQVTTELIHAAHEKSQTINTHIAPNIAEIDGDSVDFARIWRNLIGNAIKYTGEGGEINVRVGNAHLNGHRDNRIADTILQAQELIALDLPRGHYVIGQVEDNGHGISEEDKQGLFTRFNRGWAKQSNIPGTGLGLSLVKELMGLYKGDIHVSSELEKGTIFTFWIPVRTESDKMKEMT